MTASGEQDLGWEEKRQRAAVSHCELHRTICLLNYAHL